MGGGDYSVGAFADGLEVGVAGRDLGRGVEGGGEEG